MGKVYITSFSTRNEFNTFKNTSDFGEPHVTKIQEDVTVNNNGVHFYDEAKVTAMFYVPYGSQGMTNVIQGGNAHLASYYCSSVEIDDVTVPVATLDANNNQYNLSYGRHFIRYTLKSPSEIYGGMLSNLERLMWIGIPEQVRMIGIGAFTNCPNLSSIVVNSGNTSFNSNGNCNAIIKTNNNELVLGCKNTTMPSGITSIGSMAFYGCTSITSVEISSTITSIGEAAFSYCNNITSVTVDSGNTVYDSRNDCNAVIKKSDNTLVFGCKTTTIPNNVASIANCAFQGCSRLTTCVIDSGVTSIGNSAFEDCANINMIVVNRATPPSLGTNAFTRSNNSPIYVQSGSVETYKSATNWSSYASRIFGIGVDTLSAKYNVTSTTSPTQIGFNDDISGFSAIMIDGVVQPNVVSAYTFNTLGEHTVTYFLNDITSIGDNAFFKCSGLTNITIPNSVTSIGDAAFTYCSSLTSCTIGSSVTSIGDVAFSNCSGLTSINIPNSVTSIGNNAFDNCSSLTSCTIGGGVTSIGSSAFEYCSGLTSIDIPSGVTSIGNYAFDNCTSLTSVDVPNSVTSMGRGAFGSCTSLTSCTIGSGVTIIRGSTFEDCSSLTSIDIPSGVTSIDNSAFRDCTSLTSCTIGSGVTSIDVYAFYGCYSLTSIDIPNSVTSIGDYAFGSCYGLTSIDIPSGVTSIGSDAFVSCSITSITIPNSVTSIGANAFGSCSRLTSCIIGNGVTSIGNQVFYGCSALISVTVDSGNSVYDSRNDCNAIIETSTNSLIFGCKNTIIPNTVNSIAEYAFQGCSGLTSITIPSGVTSIGNQVFYGCSGLTSITCNAMTAPSIQSNTFYNVKPNGALYVPIGNSGYDAWVGSGSHYLGYYNWTKVEQ